MRCALPFIALAACADVPRVSDTQLIYAPSRGALCPLQFLHGNTGAGWQVLGYVTLYDRALQDPATRENLELIRPRACELGGTAVAVESSYVHTSPDGDQYGSAIDYVVVRPMPTPEAPTMF
jgi:hypothetical protein